MSYQGFNDTFEAFKKQFYNRIGDGSCFNMGNINLFKVALDGLKVHYSARGKTTHYFNKSNFIFYIHVFVKIIRDYKKRILLKKALSDAPLAKIFIGFTGRSTKQQGLEISTSFQKFFDEFNRETFFYVSENSGLNENILHANIPFGFNAFSRENRRFYNDLKQWVKSLDNRWTDTEKKDITFACYLFYLNFIRWDYFFKTKKFTSVFIEQHYHREGFILACQKHELKVNELQHGLIAKEDIFYVIPKQVQSIVKKALFPDRIFVYGNYWKDVLSLGCEFDQGQIINGGYTHYEIIKDIIKPERKVILITTQYSISNYYIDYIKALSPKLPKDWKIVVKIHPVEDIDIYSSIAHLNNVKVVNDDLDTWIEISEFLISIYSTTIFDAIRKDKIAFSLYYPMFADYVNGIVESNTAIALTVDENPIEKFLEIKKSNSKINKHHFYSAFNKEIFNHYLFNEN